MLRNSNKQDLVPDIEEIVQEKKTPTSDLEDPLHVQVITDEVESVSENEISSHYRLSTPRNRLTQTRQHMIVY